MPPILLDPALLDPALPDPRLPAAGSRYGVHPGIEMEQAVLRRLEEKTGRSLAAWVELAQSKGPADEKARAAWLRSEFRLGRHTATWLAARSVGRGRRYDADAIVDSLFSGRRASLRPLYEAVLSACLGLGRDVTVTPCKSAIPIRRRRVFAEIVPSARTRLDIGLALGLGPQPAPGLVNDRHRLEPRSAARRDARITHRVSLHELGDVDAQLIGWLQLAYVRAR